MDRRCFTVLVGIAVLAVGVSIAAGTIPGKDPAAEGPGSSPGPMSLQGVQPKGAAMQGPAIQRALAWSTATPIPTTLVRFAHAQDPANTSSLYVVCGVASGSGTANAWRYDTGTATWNALAPAPSALEGPSAVIDGGKLYLMGGGPGNALSIYDIATNTWSAGPALPRTVWGAAVGVFAGKIYMIGGDDDFISGGTSNLVNIFDIATSTWTGTGTPMPTATSAAGYFQVGSYLYIVGGWGDTTPATNVNATQRYDMATDSWSAGPTFTSARGDFTLAANSAKLYAIGGDANGGGFFDATATVESLDLATWPAGSWVADTGLPGTRTGSNSGFCTPGATGGDLWYVGGLDAGFNWYDTVFTSPAEGCAWGPMAALAGRTFVDTCTSGGPGDHDGIADPGEGLAYTLTVGNTGVGDLTSVQATLSTATPGVTVTTPTATYGTIPQGGAAPSPTPFAVALSPTLTCGQLIDFQLDITATEGSWTSTFQQVVGNVVPGVPTALISEAFEVWPPTAGGAWTFSHTGCGGWDSSATTGRANYTGGSGYSADADSDDCGSAMDALMVTPPFSLAGSYVSAQLQFRSDFNDYGGTDDGYVDVSTDGGTIWTNLFHYNKADFRGPRQETVDLTPYLGSADVRLRFHYVAPGWDWWWEVDDVEVTATTAPTCTMNICTGGAPCTFTCAASATPASGVAPLTVAFTASATLGPTCIGPATYLWDFGDGATDTAQNPTHIYAAGGTYTWMVTVTVDGVTCTQTGTVTANPFDLNFYDDYGRSALCVNSTSGAFTYWVLRGFGMGPYSGVGTITRYNGVVYLRTPATSPVYLNLQYMERYRKASASMAYRPGRVTSTLYDSNTTNNPPFCTP